ncbi:MAG: hypothetical protein OEM94_07200 [Acidimicrobiia bacterium]|nr:hypothetical protein [Acidimicrobiia bacterium]
MNSQQAVIGAAVADQLPLVDLFASLDGDAGQIRVGGSQLSAVENGN